MKVFNKRIEEVDKGMMARGKNELLSHLSGEDLTARQAILAKCYDCLGYMVDGKEDCKMPLCPLYPFMPYNPNKRKVKTMSDEQKKAASERLRNTRISRGDKYIVAKKDITDKRRPI